MDTVYKIQRWQGQWMPMSFWKECIERDNTEVLLLSPFGGVMCEVKHRFLHILGKCSIMQLFPISIPQNKKVKS